MMRDVYRDEQRGRLLAMQPRRSRRGRSLASGVALVVIVQVLYFLFLRAAL